jgi:ABC-type Fe3+/spermidine/putrescine transport system ATPase subunit
MIPVSIRAVSKSYGAQRVLDGLSLEIAAGEVFFLLGASGCGKTTLLRLVAGFLAPDAGAIRFADRDVTGVPAERRGIGMVFQNYALWPHLSVAGNVAFGLDLRGVAAAEKRERVEQALAMVELAGFGERRIAELSGGQQQRVALARALVIRPGVLLLDEPLSNLDARLRAQMRAEVRRVCKAAGVTAIYVTHDQQEALATADRIAVLVAGRVAQVGTPRELYERPRSRAVAEFVGEANLLPGTVAGPGAVACALGTLATTALPEGAAPGAAVLVCLRPERIRLDAAGEGNAFAAELAGQSYQGDRAQWQLAAGGTTLAASEAAPPPRAPGDRVTCRVAPADVVVLPA